jgi:hypothetical protein
MAAMWMINIVFEREKGKDSVRCWKPFMPSPHAATRERHVEHGHERVKPLPVLEYDMPSQIWSTRSPFEVSFWQNGGAQLEQAGFLGAVAMSCFWPDVRRPGQEPSNGGDDLE